MISIQSSSLGLKFSQMVYVILLLILSLVSLEAFLIPPNDKKDDLSAVPQISRRQLLTWPIGVGGAIIYGRLLADAVEKLSRGDLEYPELHERRVDLTYQRAMVAAILPNIENRDTRPFRVLEVGIGKDWRVARRGLYKGAVEELNSRGVSNLHVTGIDIVAPDPGVVNDAEKELRTSAQSSEMEIEVDVDVTMGSITSRMNVPDGWFDCVVCALTLCSVEDQDAALQEIRRLVRPDGGTFGYVEHVAVNPDEPYRLLNAQQEILDPVQQIVAENCHLHRYTDDNIVKTFHTEDDSAIASRIFHERFVVDKMWPVSCQCCGVVQRNE